MKKTIAALALTVALPAQADTLGPFSSLLVFGDSLSDPGNAYATFGEAAAPSVFYPEGQYTSGDTWATMLGADLSSGTNFAFGGAKATTDGDLSPDFAAQRDSFYASAADLGDNPLTAVFFGGNDLRGATTAAEAGAAVEAAVTSIVTGIAELASTGLDDFLVFGLPNLGRLPEIVATPDPTDDALGTRASIGFNEALQAGLASIAGLAEITYFDLFGFVEAQIAALDAEGGNIDEACLASFPLCGPDSAGGYFFYDDLHPTEEVHMALAGAVRGTLEPIPLPAAAPLLLAGLGGIAFISRRRRSRA